MARSTHAEPVAFPEIEDGLTPAEVTVGMLVEFKVADVAIAKLGGDPSGRYFPKVPKTRLVVVPGSWTDADA
jgi:hypothetical protein